MILKVIVIVTQEIKENGSLMTLRKTHYSRGKARYNVTTQAKSLHGFVHNVE